MTRSRVWLVERREELGMTQQALAEKVGVGRNAVQNWKRCRSCPGMDNRIALAAALEMRVEEITRRLKAEGKPLKARGQPAISQTHSAVLAGRSVAGGHGKALAGIAVTAETFQELDRRLGAGSLFQSVVRYLHVDIGPLLLDPLNSGDGAALFAAAASVTDLAGWMSHDAGLDRQAQAYFDRAYRLATAAHDKPLMAATCASMAHLAIELDQPTDALRIAAVGYAHAAEADGSERLSARLLAMRARGHALRGEGGHCLGSLQEAEQWLAKAGDVPSPAWTPRFDEGSLCGEAALCFSQLGELSEAARQAERVLELRGETQVRSRALAQLTLAAAMANAGHVDQAASVGTRIMTSIGSLDSGRVKTKLRALGANLFTHESVAEVADFLGRLAVPQGAMDPATGGDQKWPV